MGLVLELEGAHCRNLRNQKTPPSPEDQPLQELLRGLQKRPTHQESEEAQEVFGEGRTHPIKPAVIRHLYRYNYFPMSYLLPNEYVIFADEFRKQHGDKNVWIMKPIARSQGKGIFLFNKLSNVAAW